jgi:hypothetical protein
MYKMGFRPQPKTYKLNFKDSELDGLMVRIGGCTVGEWQDLLRLSSPDTGEEAAAANDATIELFANYLIEWDLEHSRDHCKDPEHTGADHYKIGDPVPATPEGIATQENVMITQIIVAWQRAMQYVADDLGKGSMNGSSSQEASLGLAGSSQSLRNWPKQN